MSTVRDWLHEQTAAEVMTRSVACLRPSDRLADAVNLFLRDQISGAPVVDEDGVCVGVISATDILLFEEKRAGVPEPHSRPRRHAFDTLDLAAQWWHDFGRDRHDIEPRLEEGVIAYMTRDVVSVMDDAPLGVVIRQMLDKHVHRILVLDAGRHLRGIISTMDVLAAALRAGRREPAISR